VLCSGAVLGVLGVIAAVTLPWPLPWRVAVTVFWAGPAAWELVRLHRAWHGCLALRVLADGSAAVLGRDGRWQPVTLLADGVLLRRWGWIRLRMASGRVFAEPVRGSCRKSHDWRRLQVIWRHVGADV
jgi:hypothetical protein